MNKPSTHSPTDLCVMCGMCLPHCPTYQLYQTETESPRGRLALMQSISNGRLQADTKTLLHIDHCLGCLNCESICPSKVPYGQLIDDFRQQHSAALPRAYASKQILKYAAQANGLEKISRLTQKPVIKQLLKASSALTGLSPGLFNASPDKLDPCYNACGKSSSPKPQGKVIFFTGCSAKINDTQTLKDAAYIVNRLGFDVLIPDEQHCCGAMHQHNGQMQVAQQLRLKNQSMLNQQGTQAILFFSPACGASLQQLQDVPLMDIRQFLHSQLQQSPLGFRPLEQPVALHESCSQRNMLKSKTLNLQLLKHIENIEILGSSLPSLCCGAGGLQAINYPQQARALLNAKLDSYDLSQTNVFLSDNIGCSLHIKSAISAYNTNIDLLHPVSLLARQLRPE